MSFPKAHRAAAVLQKAEAAFQRGQWREAARGYEQVLRQDPDHALSLHRLGAIAVQEQQPAEAIQRLTRALALAPDATSFLRLGNLLAAHGDWDAAQHCYAASCQLQPQHALAQYNWGVALQELDRTDDAIAAFERAITLDGAYADAYYGLGLAYKRNAAFDAALIAFDCAAGLAPEQARFPIERARTLHKLGRDEEALAALEGLSAPPPLDADIHNLRGITYRHLGRSADAMAAYDLALAAQPDALEPLYNRANLRLLARQFPGALADFDRAVALKPEVEWLAGLQLYTAMHLYDWRAFDQRLATLMAELAQQRPSVQPLALQCMVDDPAAHQQAARLWMDRQRVAGDGATWPLQPKADGRYRIAYISRDFRSHPVSFLAAELFELHDRERFEVIGINYGPVREDDLQHRLRAAFDGFMDVATLQDKQIAELCRSLQVDIAIDLSGFTEGARSGIFAWRAAPIQVLYLGYLGTSGSAVYDYLIADRILIPTEARAHYDEQILFLPSYQVNDRRRPWPERAASRAELGLPEDAFVFCCFNNPCKLTPAVFRTWADILAQVPGSVLWVLEEDPQAAVNLREHASSLGIDPQRIVLADRTRRENYLARLGAADLFLDTLPYNAGTTASDALWMGLPVLTQIGQSFCARMAASLLHAVDLPQLIAHSTADYVATAVRLAHDADELAAIRHRLKTGRNECALFDTPAFTRNLEAAYLAALHRHANGQPPIDIQLPAQR
ncbi:tetratricopeptide repeat protein [Roseateles amylovorans]|uniref:protein O-GlcNAc transferase n=1 Tax=Roseateles amylovorans TaxID=2978473 RepID=A0ABY6B082_9BURK|nr:tetratricopeptide repeat protein [Roseateles amylovorans]UXH77389.1 tetratricopeptide repeat protein [Roseateles amylovorans]